MNHYSSAICSRYNLIVSTTFICSNRLKSKMAAFLACFKIHRFHTTSFQKAPPSKPASSRSSVPLLIGLLTKEGNISNLYSSFSVKKSYHGRGMRITCQRPSFQGAVKRHPGGWHKARVSGHSCEKKAWIMTRAYFPAKYGLGATFTQEADEA